MLVTQKPTNDQISAALSAILQSPRFVRSQRSRALLSYLAEAAQSGRSETVKAFSIAVDVFGKGSDFDAEKDTLVRVQAGRLRDMLDHYYAVEGRDSEVIFSLPRGGYTLRIESRGKPDTLPMPAADVPPVAPVPAPTRGVKVSRRARIGLALLFLLGLFIGYRFTRPNEATMVAEKRPNVIRLLIAATSFDPHERALLQATRDIASRFKDFDTVTREEGSNPAYPVWPEDYRIRIEKVTVGETHAVSLVAEHAASGAVIGSARASLSPRSDLKDLLGIERAVIKLLQPFGPLYTDYQRRGEYAPVMRCVLLRHDYDVDQTDERHTAARDCAEALIAQGVEDSRNYLALAYMHMEEHTDQRNLRPGDPLQRAMQAALRASELSPASSEAHERLMTVYALTGNFDQMIAAGRRAIELNPSNSAALDNFGARLNYRRQHAEALSLLLRAEELQPVAPRWRAYAFFLAYYGQGMMKQAVERAATLTGTTNPLYIAARAIVARFAGDVVERNEALIALAREERSFLKEPRAMYERRQYDPVLIDRLVEDLTSTDMALGPPRAGRRQP